MPSTVAQRRGTSGWGRSGTKVPGYLQEIATRLVPRSAWADLRTLNRCQAGFAVIFRLGRAVAVAVG